jgi:hypothetical protein
MTIFNKEKVTHIQITDLTKTNYIWCDEIKEKRIFFNIILLIEGYKAGFYKGNQTGCFSIRIDKPEEGSVDINGVLHWLPTVKVYINRECVGFKYFDTIEEAKDFCKKEFPNVDYKV